MVHAGMRARAAPLASYLVHFAPIATPRAYAREGKRTSDLTFALPDLPWENNGFNVRSGAPRHAAFTCNATGLIRRGRFSTGTRVFFRAPAAGSSQL
jgi:hypothetical protein